MRPRDVVGKTRRRVAADELANLMTIEKKVKALTIEIKAIVTERGSNLMDLPGVGPVVAARILADVGDVAAKHDHGCAAVQRCFLSSLLGTVTVCRVKRGYGWVWPSW